MSAKQQLTAALAEMPDTISVEEAVDRLCRAFKLKRAYLAAQESIAAVRADAPPPDDQLPPDQTAALAELSSLDDESLWRAARSHLSSEAAARLEALHLKRQREGLTDSEAQMTADLVNEYERAMLVRAQAAALLKKRGYDIAGLVRGA